MFYDVHIFAVLRVKVPNIEAESQAAAIKLADGRLQEIDLAELMPSVPAGIEHIEDIGECAHYLVDEVGDQEYEHSRYYERDGVTPMPEEVLARADVPAR